MRYKAICDVCGWEYFASQLKKRWDGLMVCNQDWEVRHPMDFLKGRKEDLSLPWTRPEPTDEFVEVTYIFEAEDVPDGTFNQGL